MLQMLQMLLTASYASHASDTSDTSDTSSSTFLRSGMSLVGSKVEEVEDGGGRRWRR